MRISFSRDIELSAAASPAHAFRTLEQFIVSRKLHGNAELSNYLFLRNSRRKTVTHFSWNCSNRLFTWRVGRNR
ncbi:hypothetical protein EN827_26395 [Mesorhizobium sp. M1D.F.Ca.ET.184.01.1.1]|nr:hypothetical protein EN874_028025 [Mesorhizobium sp. M1D.F.Ca.ET.231.01.1.1]TGP25748.1 hypothetical protein EN877_28145 [Mesorhizobium sp. M1D.F.Ca.ET.234.01.1.1]TGS40559.1 hypothetical protein EN827_26395 [Mesorhizobium sp. M1D.F.Ca.ET.184.01.1.1]TGS59004.1 hypothetical protein EN826_026395 [Mesorhizobium sp. M1D.F.Ca.ET.183.01.1.1]